MSFLETELTVLDRLDFVSALTGGREDKLDKTKEVQDTCDITGGFMTLGTFHNEIRQINLQYSCS